MDTITLRGSPIEFVVVGPFMGRDRVLVKSENAGLDLIGLAARSGLLPDQKLTPKAGVPLFGQSRPLNSVTTFGVLDLNPESDSRKSHFTFAWGGYASALGVKTVEKTVNAALPDLYAAIKTENLADVEWALAPVIYSCTEANERRLRAQRSLRLILLFYTLLGIAAVIGLYLSKDSL